MKLIKITVFGDTISKFLTFIYSFIHSFTYLLGKGGGLAWHGCAVEYMYRQRITCRISLTCHHEVARIKLVILSNNCPCALSHLTTPTIYSLGLHFQAFFTFSNVSEEKKINKHKNDKFTQTFMSWSYKAYGISTS